MKERKIKILFVQPSVYKRDIKIYPPLALQNLISLTPNNEFDVELADDQYEEIPFSKKYDLIAISTWTPNSKRAYEIADQFRSKGNKVIIGGVHVSFFPDEAALHSDSVVIGEAEIVWKEVLQDIKKGLLKKRYKSGLIDLNLLPTLNSKYSDNYLVPCVQATRGCPNLCEFCSVRVFSGNSLRKRPVNDVIKDIISVTKNKKFKALFIVDDNLFVDRTYAIELFKKMIPLKVHFTIQAPITAVFDKELLDYCYKAGCRIMGIGFDSINDEAIKNIKKFNLIRKFKEGIEILHKKGIYVWASFIFGFDEDKEDCVRKTIDFAINNNIEICVLCMLTPFPGTILFKKKKKEGRITSFDWSKYNPQQSCVINPENISQRKLVEQVKKEYKRFYSWRSIIKRMAALKYDFRPVRIFGYIITNLFFKKEYS
jgi:radical SAM superfamily enzyme YgiQ (UPF0313 family)